MTEYYVTDINDKNNNGIIATVFTKKNEQEVKLIKVNDEYVDGNKENKDNENDMCEILHHRRSQNEEEQQQLDYENDRHINYSTMLLPCHAETDLVGSSTRSLSTRKRTGSSIRSTIETIMGVAGNVLEWYDFAVFGYFSDIIGELFFPPQDGNAALIETFTVFGGAFLMRPLGGFLMGYIGDLYGRKRALVTSIFLMAFPTFAMGCLPTYNQVGNISILCLIITRSLQGLAAGGQLMSSLVYTVEKHPRNKWGLYSSFVMSSAMFGTLLGGLVGFVLRSLILTSEQLYSWGWRIPFISGILVGLCGLYLRCYAQEEEEEEEEQQEWKHCSHCRRHHLHHDHHYHPSQEPQQQQENPIKVAFHPKNRRALLSSCMVPMLFAGGFYLCFVWMAIYMNELIDKPLQNAFAINSLSLFTMCIAFPLAGLISDVMGRIRTMIMGGCIMILSSPFLIYIIGLGNAPLAFCAQSMLGILLSLWGAPMLAWLVESFPPNVRLTSVSIGYNIANATAGGSCPTLATIFVSTFGPYYSPVCILCALTLISILGLYIAPSVVERPPFPPASIDDIHRNTSLLYQHGYGERSIPFAGATLNDERKKKKMESKCSFP